MKKNILTVLFLFCTMAFSQSYIGSWMVDEAPAAQPQSEQTQAAELSQTESEAAQPVVTASVNYSDSALYYDQLATKFATEGEAMRSSGSSKLGLGIIGAVLGAGLFIYTIANEDDFCQETYSNGYNYNCELNGAGTLLVLGSVAVMGGSTALIIVGGVKKGRGSSKIRRAEKYRKEADNFRMKDQHVQLFLQPEVNPFKKSVGARLALNI